jgi:hypothetical protein
MYNLNNFVLMISLSRLKNTIDKNFNFIEIKNQNIINVQLKSNIIKFLENNVEEFNEEINKEMNENIKQNNSEIEKKDDCECIQSVEESNFLFNSFIHIADSFKFDSEDWYLIYEDTDKIKNK